MRYMNFSAVLERLEKSGTLVFSVQDVAKVMHKSTAYASLLLSRHRNIVRLKKGVYYIAGAGMYEIASNVVYPSYISLGAALQYYDLIDQNIVRYSVITTKRHKELSTRQGTVEFITLSKDRVFGYTSDGNAYIATVEKTFIDCLYLGRPEFKQVEESFASALQDYKVRIDILKEFGIKMRSRSLINKLGFLLERSGIAADDLVSYTYRSKYVKVSRHADSRDRKWAVLYDR